MNGETAYQKAGRRIYGDEAKIGRLSFEVDPTLRKIVCTDMNTGNLIRIASFPEGLEDVFSDGATAEHMEALGHSLIDAFQHHYRENAAERSEREASGTRTGNLDSHLCDIALRLSDRLHQLQTKRARIAEKKVSKKNKLRLFKIDFEVEGVIRQMHYLSGIMNDGVVLAVETMTQTDRWGGGCQIQ